MAGLPVSRIDLERYGKWYSRIRIVIRTRYGADADLFIDLLAALSPRSQVSRNWRMAVKVYREYKSGHGVRWDDIMQSHRPNVMRALRREPLSGQKVWRFAENLRQDSDVVTVDVWICRAFGADFTHLTADKYAEIENEIRRQATDLGVLPSEYQAALWQVTRQQEGRKPVSFMRVVDDERQMNFWEVQR